jgi:predicted permease
MTDIIQVAYDVILPIFIVIGVGAVIGLRFNPDRRALSTLLIYVFSPAIVFRGLATSKLNGSELGQIVVMYLGMTLLLAFAGWAMTRPLHLDPCLQSAFILTVVLPNAGNFGLPLNRFAFGEAGEARAVAFYAVSGVVSNTLGVYLASSGSASTRKALANVFKVPLPYAAALGLAVNLTGADIFAAGGGLEPLGKAIDLLADAAVPGMLTLLGLQLVRTSFRGQMRLILLATGTRLVLAPLVAFPAAALLGLAGVTRQVSIIEVSMPTAVMTVVLATQFDSDAEFTSAVILASTIASVLSLSVLLAILL